LTAGFAAKRYEPALPERGSQASLGGRGSKRLPRVVESSAAMLGGEEQELAVGIDKRAAGCIVRWQSVASDAQSRRQSEEAFSFRHVPSNNRSKVGCLVSPEVCLYETKNI